MRLAFCLLVLAPCTAYLAPLSVAQEPPPDSALALVYQAYGEVLGGLALESTFTTTFVTPDTTFSESGRALTHVDAETETSRFRIDYEDGEISLATLNEDTYQVEFPRTETVYVDSTREEMYNGTASLLLFHPAFSTDLFYFASVAERTLIGPDKVDKAPCTRAEYTIGTDSTSFTLSICFDDALRLPRQIRTTSTDSIATVTVYSAFRATEIPPPGTFEIPLLDQFERVPYDRSDQPPLALNQPAPAFALPNASGELIHLDAYRGRYVLIDFWGTWCAPCVQAIPHLAQLEQTYPELVILGLASHEYEGEDPTGFVRARGANYPILLADDETIEAYRVHAFPTYYVVDPDGTIVFSAVEDGETVAQDQLDAFLADLFTE